MTRTARILVLCCYGLIGAAWLLPAPEPGPVLRTEMTAPKLPSPMVIPAMPASVGYYAVPPFTPEDMWAYTTLQQKALPPAQYDHLGAAIKNQPLTGDEKETLESASTAFFA
jgi:hypothetical protein